MKKKLLTAACVFAVGACNMNTASAGEPDKAAGAAVDVLIARPLCFAATAVGTVAFVISLPFAAPSKSIKKSANALVMQPGKATFTRPIGDFSSLPE